ncbi:MAG: uracil-DNA glycosylase [Candidatus Micrarchaeaceae archaeon]
MKNLRKSIIACERCPRLVRYRQSIGEGWRKPVPGFGDVDARLVIIGPAPSLYGGNRTGRVFTGDKSGDFLFKALYEVGFSNSPVSKDKDDGLKLEDCYITDIVKCSPPDNTPLPLEVKNCSQYINAELDMLKRKKVILVLGGLAFSGVKSYLLSRGAGAKGIKFKHNFAYRLGGIILQCCFHPSPRNTNTHRLEYREFVNILLNIKANYLD